MFGYKVKISSYCNENYHSGERYGDWHTSHTNTFEGVVISKDKHPDAVSVEEIKVGEIAYVVWVEWSSGDSFGHGDRCSTDVLAIFSKSDDAVGLAQHIRSQSDNGDSKYKFTASTGQVFECGYAGWSGYFETLNDIHVEAVIVGLDSRTF